MSQTTTNSTTTPQDRDCAVFARAALFPSRLHRDVTHGGHFPALLALDRLRAKLQDTAASYLFPRHVVVVRNLADETIQWNGQPDLHEDASFEVIPNKLSVRCAEKHYQCQNNQNHRSFLQEVAQSDGRTITEIVLCSNRILQKDYVPNQLENMIMHDRLPIRSLHSVEETLAHELVKVEDGASPGVNNHDAASIEVRAAQAAECYYSRHPDQKQRMQVRKGSRLQKGYSYLPSRLQSWAMDKCVAEVSMEHLLRGDATLSQSLARNAVKEAMKQNGGTAMP